MLMTWSSTVMRSEVVRSGYTTGIYSLKTFDLLGFTKEEALEQFGFLMGAFEYGAPPSWRNCFWLSIACVQ
jgi:hypothetical protein